MTKKQPILDKVAEASMIVDKAVADVEYHYKTFGDAMRGSDLCRPYAKRINTLFGPCSRLVDLLNKDDRLICLRNHKGQWFIGPERVRKDYPETWQRLFYFNPLGYG